MTRSTMMNALYNPNDIQEEQSRNQTKVFAETHYDVLKEELKMTMSNTTTNLAVNNSGDWAAVIPQMLTIRQLAERTAKMGIKEYRIRQWVVNGELPCIKAGNKYLISVLDFVAFITHASKKQEEEVEPETTSGTARGGNGRIRPLK